MISVVISFGLIIYWIIGLFHWLDDKLDEDCPKRGLLKYLIIWPVYMYDDWVDIIEESND